MLSITYTHLIMLVASVALLAHAAGMIVGVAFSHLVNMRDSESRRAVRPLPHEKLLTPQQRFSDTRHTAARRKAAV